MSSCIWRANHYKQQVQKGAMNVREHKFLVSFAILVLLAKLTAPIPLPFLILFLYYPGILLLSLMKRKFDAVEGLFLPLLVGISFWIVFSYCVSECNVLHWVTVLVISCASAVMTDMRGITFEWVNRDEIILLVVCCLFMVSYSYPWTQFYQWVPPGDDMKYHLTHIQNISASHSLPDNYGGLYPEVSTLTYPLGYHVIASLNTFTSSVSLSSVVVTTLFILLLSCFSFYFLGKVLFNSRVGVYSAFSLSFLSLFSHRLLSTSTYPNVLAISLQVVAFSFLVMSLNSSRRTIPLIILSGLTLAAAGETHTYILLLNVFVFCFLFFLFLLKRNFLRVRILLYTGIVFLLLCVPYLLRLHFETPSTIEMWTYTVWYQEDSIATLSDFTRNLSILSPFVVLFGILGVIASRKNGFISSWVAAVVLIPFLSFLHIQYPGWYTVSPNRFFFYLFAPLCVLSGKFVADIENTLPRNKFLAFMTVTVFLSVGMHHLNLFDSFLPDPVSEVQMNPDDEFVMQWIITNTPEDAVILNTGPTVDCSSWIPILCERRVVFPSFSGHRGDNCIEKVGAHRKRADLWIVEYTPDSNLALHVLEKYNISYVYIPAWKKRWYLELSPQKLLESPLYKPVVKKGNAYLFRVNYDKLPGTTYFVLQRTNSVTMEGEQLFKFSFSPLLSPDAQGRLFLHIKYTDDSYGQIDIAQNDEYAATILKYKTGEEKEMIYPLEGSKVNLLFYPEFDFLADELDILFGVDNTVRISECIGLKGTWVSELQLGSEERELVTASPEDASLRIYLVNAGKGELVITYKDKGYGNVDINVPGIQGAWNTVEIIERENSGEIKEVRIPIDGEYAVFVLGVYVYGDEFALSSIEYEPAVTMHEYCI